MKKSTTAHPMKPSTYASLVTIVFLLHKNAKSKSIASVIRSTDQLSALLGYENTVSRMSKYRIISELLSHDILNAQETSKNKKIFLSPSIIELLNQNAE
jgi:hypothetical protein